MRELAAEAAVIFTMLVFNAAFAAYEMALASVSKARIRHLKEKDAPGAAAAHFMKERLEASLSLIQIGITLAGAAAAATGGAGVNEYIAPLIQAAFGTTEGTADVIGLIAFVLPLSFLTIMFGELVPKIFAIENKELVLLKLSPFVRALYWVLSPLVAVFERLIKLLMKATKAVFPVKSIYQEHAAISELKSAAAQARAESLIGRMEEKIVNAAAMLSLRKVEELAVPVSAFSYIPIGMTLADALVRAHMDLHTRFPVTRRDGAPGEVAGYVNFKDIVNALKMKAPAADVASITRPMEKIDSGLPVPRALEDMISKHIHMAVVTGPGGEVLGLLTLEDMISQLVGPIKDEYDRLPSYLYAAGGGLIAGGGADMAEILRKLELKPETGNITLAAWAESQLGRHPRGSELLTAGRVEVLVRKTRRNRVSEAFIRKLPVPPAI